MAKRTLTALREEARRKGARLDDAVRFAATKAGADQVSSKNFAGRESGP
jgi:hypothetical protein